MFHKGRVNTATGRVYFEFKRRDDGQWSAFLDFNHVTTQFRGSRSSVVNAVRLATGRFPL